MALALTGINTGVVRHGNQFQALALNLQHKNRDTSLIFIPPLQLRDLYLYVEYRLHLQQQRNASEQATFKKNQHLATQSLLKNVPPLTRKQMLEADIRLWVTKLEPQEYPPGKFQLALTLQGGNTLEIHIEDTQIALFISAITHAINNAGTHQLSLRISSLLDFLPVYDADMTDGDEMAYDTYPHPAWKLALFTHYLALVYHYTDSDGQTRACGTVVKSRVRGEMREAQAIAQRLLEFSPRLKKVVGKPCRISVSTIATSSGHFPQERCLRALHQLYRSTQATSAE